MTRKQPQFIRLAAFIAAVVVIAFGVPGQAHADGKSPIVIASADGSGGAGTGRAGSGECNSRLRGQDICCHRAAADTLSGNSIRPRGEDKPLLPAGYVKLLPHPV